MSPTKVLNINPDFFSLKQNGNSKTLKREKKQKPSNVNPSNSMRKALLAKIRTYQKREEDKKNIINLKDKQDKENEDDFENEFNKSLNFLQEISNKNKDKHKNKSLKNQVVRPKEQFVNVDLPEALIDMPYANVERNYDNNPDIINNQSNDTININSNYFNGVTPQSETIIDNQFALKPLIRIPTEHAQIQAPIQTPIPAPIQAPIPAPIQAPIPAPIPAPIQIQIPAPIQAPIPVPIQIPTTIKTSIKKMKPLPSVVHNLTLKNPPPYSNLKGGNKPTFREWNKTYKNNPHDLSTSNVTISEKIKRPSKKLITRKTKTIKYNLGKKGKNVGILIKNNNTRKKIKKELMTLRRKPILEVKDYLHQKNLIKTGSLAPNDVLREIYEQSILSGDVINENKQTLIHNFLSKNESF